MLSRFANCKRRETPSFTTHEKAKVNDADQFLPGSFKCKSNSSISDWLNSPENLRGSSSSLTTEESACYLSASDTGDSSRKEKEKAEEIEDDLIAVLTYSPSPYEDFRRSMQEVVEARLERNGEVDWEFMVDLLFRYLDLNNEKFRRYIMRAFVDLVVVLRENCWEIPAGSRPWDGGGDGGGGLPEREM